MMGMRLVEDQGRVDNHGCPWDEFAWHLSVEIWHVLQALGIASFPGLHPASHCLKYGYILLHDYDVISRLIEKKGNILCVVQWT